MFKSKSAKAAKAMQKANEVSSDECVALLERFGDALQRLADAEGATMVRRHPPLPLAARHQRPPAAARRHHHGRALAHEILFRNVYRKSWSINSQYSHPAPSAAAAAAAATRCVHRPPPMSTRTTSPSSCNRPSTRQSRSRPDR